MLSLRFRVRQAAKWKCLMSNGQCQWQCQRGTNSLRIAGTHPKSSGWIVAGKLHHRQRDEPTKSQPWLVGKPKVYGFSRASSTRAGRAPEWIDGWMGGRWTYSHPRGTGHSHSYSHSEVHYSRYGAKGAPHTHTHFIVNGYSRKQLSIMKIAVYRLKYSITYMYNILVCR